ncbi:hypothetical protein HC248_01390 [Polaromonas vacuolata]|uniref:Uncharacterized protein n=1 Tax=Polaromonas vacuolata TaxID=37448 RepID=A0A6H2H933_9BURK|nr:hypothetical protein [Polaromonas vacuolata]QJC56104.1 hypothetical protein HC248_01390 [Polaromonas vacuolata]
MTDMRCPYCEADQKVCQDDSGKYSESERHEHTCTSCDKNFVFRTNISFNYNPKKADCLNGEPHILQLTKTWPKNIRRGGAKVVTLSEI